MAELSDLSIPVELPPADEVDLKALLLVTRQIMRRNRRALKQLAEVLQIDVSNGHGRVTDHQLAERLIEKADLLMSANARRMGTLTHQPHTKKKPTRH